MPTTQRALSPSAANNAIGGVPSIHYFDLQSRGRGQAVRLFFEDAQIAYDDVRYSFKEYPNFKQSELAKLNPVQTIPVIEVGGKVLTQSYAILRHFARLLGKYDGTSEEAKYWADAICDVAADWRSAFVKAFFGGGPDAYTEHKQGDRARFLQGIEKHLSTHDLSKSGPFITGSDFTYADIVLYQICHDESLTQDQRKGLQGHPRLVQFVDAVEARPNIKAFLASERYKG